MSCSSSVPLVRTTAHHVDSKIESTVRNLRDDLRNLFYERKRVARAWLKAPCINVDVDPGFAGDVREQCAIAMLTVAFAA
jgi:hypothetical protein